MNKPQVNIAHAVTEDYRKTLEQIIRDGVCPFCVDFCQGNKPKYHPNPIIIETDWWAVTENMRPYPGSSLHLLLVYKKHVLYPWEIDQKAWNDLRNVMQKLATDYSLTHGTLFQRFGDTEFTGASVTHFHGQLIVGTSRNEGTDPLVVYCGYKIPGK